MLTKTNRLVLFKRKILVNLKNRTYKLSYTIRFKISAEF